MVTSTHRNATHLEEPVQHRRSQPATRANPERTTVRKGPIVQEVNTARKPYRLLVSLVFLLSIAMFAFGQSREDTLIVAQGGDPRSISPFSSTAQQEKNISNQVVERLINFGYEGEGYIPMLATAWEYQNSDTIRLTLREGVSFTNGEPFNAESAKWSLDQMMVAPPYASFVALLDRIEVVDDSTIDVIAKAPTPELLMLNALALGSFMYPPVYTQEVGVLEGFGQEPIGTGPFVFNEWVKDDHITLDANPDYWGGAPKFERLIFRPIPEAAARVAALEAGDIDFTIDVSLDSFQRLANEANIVAVAAPGGRVYRVTMSTLDPDSPLADVNVRRALLHAVDVDAILEFVLGGRGVRVNQIVSPTTFGYNTSIPTISYDPELARQMLADAGYPDGVTVNFDYTNGRYPQDSEIAQLLASQLEEAGVKVNQNVLESGEFLNRLVTLALKDLFYSGSLTPPDAHDAYGSYKCGFRYSYYCNEEFDRLYTEASVTTDAAARQQTYNELSQILYDDAHVIPMFVMNDLYAHRTGITGWTPSRDQFLDFTKLGRE